LYKIWTDVPSLPVICLQVLQRKWIQFSGHMKESK
jgi:hypothetical protein